MRQIIERSLLDFLSTESVWSHKQYVPVGHAFMVVLNKSAGYVPSDGSNHRLGIEPPLSGPLSTKPVWSDWQYILLWSVFGLFWVNSPVMCFPMGQIVESSLSDLLSTESVWSHGQYVPVGHAFMVVLNKSAGYMPSDGSNHRASTVGLAIDQTCLIWLAVHSALVSFRVVLSKLAGYVLSNEANHGTFTVGSPINRIWLILQAVCSGRACFHGYSEQISWLCAFRWVKP